MPVVHQEHVKHEPERVVKNEWGIIMIDGTEKTSLPWHAVQSIKETIPTEDAPETQTYADVRDDAEVIR